MKKYLQQHGIKESCIEMEDQSTTTKENLAFSAAMLPDMNCPVGIVTNNFHIYRQDNTPGNLDIKIHAAFRQGAAGSCFLIMQ